MTRIVLFVLVFLCAAPAATLEMSVRPISPGGIWKSDGVGSLSFLGGWTLSAEDETFGGFSALEVFDGDLLSVSDHGGLINLGPLETWRNKTAAHKKQVAWRSIPVDRSALKGRGPATDAESMTIDQHGNLLISFEREHRIQVHKSLEAKPYTYEVPIALRRPAPLNFGVEAMTTLNDGRIFAVSERVKRDGGFRAYLISGDKGQKRELMVYVPEEDWLPSGATTLPNGDLLLLERRVSVSLLGFRTRLVLLPKADLFAGARLKPQPLFTFGFGSVGADNVEGIINVVNKDGQLEIWAITDDNFRSFQRTHLLRFNLQLEQPKT
ncbi:MAG: esterase-like activity of phytase family protein [Alphaproteobacteria bacterium]